MKKFLLTLVAASLASALAIAQDTGGASSSANTNSWTGLLVAAGCSSGMTTGTKGTADAGMPRSTPTPAREQNTTYEDRAKQADRSSTGSSASKNDAMARRTDRGASVDQATPALTDPVTTPPVDDKGTRGSATKNTPSTGMKDQSNTADRSKSGMDADRAKTNGSVDRSCYIGQSTTAFALKLKDGRIVNFDDASNGKIAQQLQSGDRLQNKVKIFRATVKGAMQGDTITVDSIQM
jgi:hypothetical protein